MRLPGYSVLPAITSPPARVVMQAGCWSLVLLSFSPQAAPVRVDGDGGAIFVHGMMTEGTCQVAMDSAWQEVSLADTPTVKLQRPGDQGTPVAFQVHLNGCYRDAGSVTDRESGTLTWSSSQPVLSVSFQGAADAGTPELLQVAGASGIGLRITDSQGRDIRLGRRGPPQVLSGTDNVLGWTVVPERTASPLVAGAYRAVVNFTVDYD